MKKKKILVLGLVALLTGCSGNTKNPEVVLGKFHSGNAGLNYQTAAFAKHSVSYDMEPMRDKYQELLDAIENKNLELVTSIYDEINELAIRLVDVYTIATIKYQASRSSTYKEDYRNLLNDYYEYYELDDEAIFSAVDKGYQPVIDYFLESFSEEDKAYYLGTPSKSAELLEELTIMQSDAEQAWAERDTNENFYDDAIDAFVEYATVYDEYAKLKGYDSPLEMAYKEKREYTISDTKSFLSKIKQTLSPIYKALDFSYLDENDQRRIEKTANLSFAHEQVEFGEYLDEYAYAMGGDFYENYKKVFLDGLVCFSDCSDSTGSAATAALYTEETPLLYFSKSYQAPLNVMHEFGHCNAILCGGKSATTDVEETHSQANELMLASYLHQTHPEDNFLKAFYELAINDAAKGLFKTAYAADCEQYLFANYATSTKEELKEGLHNIYAQYPPVVDEIYWAAVVIPSTGYYISYTTSVIEALLLGAKANEDFNAAKKCFNQLAYGDRSLDDISFWEAAGLTSPFEQSTINNVKDILD